MAVYQSWDHEFPVEIDDRHALALSPVEHFIGWLGVGGEFGHAVDFAVGEESLEVRLFTESEIPWSELAFPTIGRTLECFFADRRQNLFPVRNEPLEALRTHYTPR